MLQFNNSRIKYKRLIMFLGKSLSSYFTSRIFIRRKVYSTIRIKYILFSTR
nr:MAG TPA: hypothetical protein [Caudoviricetes sp.]